MRLDSYSIAFDYSLEGGKINVRLTAEVELHHSKPYYIVRNFRTVYHPNGSILPEVQLKRFKGRWVHRDSEKATDLSQAIGDAIEAYEKDDTP